MDTSLKQNIITLRDQGKTYKEIREELSCSNGAIAYHCNKTTKERMHYLKTVRAEGGNPPLLRVLKSTKAVCIFCGKQLKSHKGLFCGPKCNSEYKFTELFSKWVSGELIGDRRILRRGLSKLYGYKCSECGISEWNGKPITLQVDHIDGNASNDAIPNLRLMCPNCHTQTDTYCGKNVGKGRGSLGISRS